AGIVRRRGDSKIGDANVALAVEHHVRRLQIAVDDAAVVRRRDAGAQLPRDVERFVLRKAPDAAEQRAEILAVHVLHRQKRTAVRFAEVVEADDVLVRPLPPRPSIATRRYRPAMIAPVAKRFESVRGPGIVATVAAVTPSVGSSSDFTRAIIDNGADDWRQIR